MIYLKKDVDYELDIVLPSSTPGATGPQGPTGPMGPISPQDLLYINFQNLTVNTNLRIKNYYIFPQNSDVFTIKNDQIFLNKPGNYEYIFSGKLNGKTTGSRGPNITVKLTRDYGTTGFDTMSLTPQIEEMAFSRTKLINIPAQTELKFIFSTNGAIGAEVELAKLIVRYLAF